MSAYGFNATYSVHHNCSAASRQSCIQDIACSDRDDGDHQCSLTCPLNYSQHLGNGCCHHVSHSLLTHTHCRFTALCPALPGWAGTRRHSGFLRGVGKIREASVPKIRLDTTPSGPSMPPLPSSPRFYALPAAQFDPGLGQAPNILDCIPRGLVIPGGLLFTYLHNRCLCVSE